MFIVYFNNNRKHSAWDTQAEALNQVRVLREHGCKSVWCEFDSTVHCENGHYYV